MKAQLSKLLQCDRLENDPPSDWLCWIPFSSLAVAKPSAAVTQSQH